MKTPQIEALPGMTPLGAKPNLPIYLICCCCGQSTRGRQWRNRDTGYGLCNDCIGIRGCNVQDVAVGSVDPENLYGMRGYHWDVDRLAAAERVLAEKMKPARLSPPEGTSQNRVWVVTAPSAYRPMHTCFLGRGATKAAALADAYGPRESWGNNTRKSMRIADVYETDEATADELEGGASS